MSQTQAGQGAAIILMPNDITLSMIDAGTSVPEVDTSRGEVAWVAGAHSAGDRLVNFEGNLYTAVAAPGAVQPGTDTRVWRRTGPSNRMAPFDLMRSTAAQAQGELVFVIKAGFFTGLRLSGLAGDRLEITLMEHIEGVDQVVQQWQWDMFEQALGLFEYLYQPLRQIDQKAIFDLPLLADARLHIRITAGSSGRCAIGMLTLGFWETLLGSMPSFGGVEYGAQAEIKTYTDVEEDSDGGWVITPRAGGPATNIDCTVVIDADQANAAHALLSRVAGKPVAFIASQLGRYDYLNTLAILNATVSPTDYKHATLRITGRGSI